MAQKKFGALDRHPAGATLRVMLGSPAPLARHRRSAGGGPSHVARVAVGVILGASLAHEARAAEAEGPLAPVQLGWRAGVGVAHVRTGDFHGDKPSIPLALLGRVGVRLVPALSLSVEGGALGLFPLPYTQTTEARPTLRAGVPRYPVLLGVVSGTVGLRPIRYVELTLGPTVGGGPTLVGGGTARLGVRIPTRTAVVLCPSIEGFLLSGDRTGYGAVFGTFGFEI